MTRRLSRIALFMGLAASALASAGIALAASSPTISVGRPTSITNSSAVVRATIRPGAAKTFYVVQSGLTTSYGVTSPTKSVSGTPASANVAVKLSGLLPGTVYHYRVLALNKYGSASSADHQVKTSGPPPAEVATGAAELATPNIVALTGVLNPHNAGTQYYFQFGQSGLPLGFGGQTQPQSVPAGTAPRTVAAVIGGLAPSTTYNFRLVAVHSGGVYSYGSYVSFTTFPAPRPRPTFHVGISPHRVRRGPYAFALFGHLIGPSSFAAAQECSGNIVAKFQLGRRLIDTELTTVSPDCRFRTAVVFNHLPGHGKRNRKVRLKVTISFRGNHYLFPASARPIGLLLG